MLLHFRRRGTKEREVKDLSGKMNVRDIFSKKMEEKTT